MAYLRENWERLLCALLLLALAVVLWAGDGFGQTFGRDRIDINRYVRDMTANLQTTFVPDTAINRIINVAHQATMLALAGASNIDIDTIITTQGKMAYTIDANAMLGSVSGVSRRIETSQGGGDIGFVEIDLSQIGKLGEGVIPNSYALRGNQVLLGTTPTGSDTLFVYYTPIANTMDADTADVSLATEDDAALVFLACALTCFRDKQLNLGQQYVALWRDMVGLKKPTPQAAEQ